MDFDLAQVRAFVAVAEHRHFGRAAGGLHLTQQALSRRVQRLERLLGTQLFARGSGGVELTGAGQRFLPHARRLLAVAESAEADARSVDRPLRVDIWGVLPMAPYRFVERLAAAEPSLPTEPSMRRSVGAALGALQRGEVDVAFGRVHDVGRPWPAGLRSRIAQLEPAAALLGADHPLAGARAIRPAELKGGVLSAPPLSTAPEMLRWVERFAEDFGMTVAHRDNGVLSGPHPQILAGALGDAQAGVALLPAGTEVGGGRMRLVPLADPVPRYPWSVIWRRDDQSPLLARFLLHLSEAGREAGWTAYDPAADWLPEPDRAGPAA